MTVPLWVGGLKNSSVSPSPLGTNWVFEIGLTGFWMDLGGLGTKGSGTVLDNYTILNINLFKLFVAFCD